MSEPLSPIQLVERLVQERTGLAPSRVHAATREHLIRLAMAREGVTDARSYRALLEREPRVFEALISALTIPESYFFREPAHFDLMQRELLPALVRSRGPSHTLQLWSAGCAGGEEPYSLAVMLERVGLAEQGRVLGTDISQAALQRAESALYSRWALRATAARDVACYFREERGQYRLISRVQQHVRLQQHNLAAQPYPAPSCAAFGFDLILCRNVLIYFDAASTMQVGQRLARSLAPDGWLLLGPSDPALDLEPWCERVRSSSALLYRRRAGHESATSSASISMRSGDAAPTAALQRTAVVPLANSSSAWGRGRDGAALEVASPDEPSDSVDPAATVQRLGAELGARAAESACRDELKRHPLDAELHLTHAKLLIELGQDDVAELSLRRALYLDRTLPLAQLLSATLAERRGDREAAQRSYAQLAERCSARGADELVARGERLTCGELAAIAAERARTLGGKART
jgi:chemotaxis protein methyltransferase CheR